MIKSIKCKQRGTSKVKKKNVGTHRISLCISTMVTLKMHVAVHSGFHQSKLIHGSHHALLHESVCHHCWYV